MISYSSPYKNVRARYSTELSRILLFRLPPRDDLTTMGLTGNFLPVKVIIKSFRRFGRLRGWFWIKYAVTHHVAVVKENVELYKLNDYMMMRLLYRLWTTNVDEVDIYNVLYDEADYKYITILDYRNSNNILIFYINEVRRNDISKNLNHLMHLRFKLFRFKRFRRDINNYVCQYNRDYDYLINVLFEENLGFS